MPYLRRTRVRGRLISTAGGAGQATTHHHRLRMPAMSISMVPRSEDIKTLPTLLNSVVASPSKAPLLRDFDGDE